MIKDYLDCCIFIDTPLDIALARKVLRDMKESSADDIRYEMDVYLKYARIAYVQMLQDILPISDYVIDGTKELKIIINEAMEIILKMLNFVLSNNTLTKKRSRFKICSS